MLNSLTYLYVEDDPFSRQVMTLIMRNAMGVERLHILENSERFLENIKALNPAPDVILLDIHVQPHNGFEMLNMLRADSSYAKTRVVALTASVMSDEVDHLRSAGFDATIGKPLSVLTFPDLMKQIVLGQSVWHIPS